MIEVSYLERVISEDKTKIFGTIPRRGGIPPRERRLKKINIFRILLDKMEFRLFRSVMENI